MREYRGVLVYRVINNVGACVAELKDSHKLFLGCEHRCDKERERNEGNEIERRSSSCNKGNIEAYAPCGEIEYAKKYFFPDRSGGIFSVPDNVYSAMYRCDKAGQASGKPLTDQKHIGCRKNI